MLNKEYNGDKKVKIDKISEHGKGSALARERLSHEYTGDEYSSCRAIFDGQTLIEKSAFGDILQFAEEDKQKAVKAKAEREQNVALCKEQLKSRDAYVKSINYIGSLSSYASTVNLLNLAFKGVIPFPMPDLHLNGRYEIYGSVTDVFNNGVIVNIADSGFIVFVYTSDNYYDGMRFSDTSLYEYTGNRSFETVLGNKRTVPAFRKTQHRIDDIPKLDSQCDELDRQGLL